MTRKHPAFDTRPLASIAVLVLMMFTLSACGTTGLGGISGLSGESRAERLARDGRHDEAASEYIGLASSASGDERDRLTLLAVEQWLDAGDITRARNATRQVIQPAGGDLLWLWNTNSAAMALYEGNPESALEILEPMSRAALPLRDRLRAEALRADAYFQLRDPQRAVELMIQRETYLRDSELIERNRVRLWQGLRISDPQVLREAAQVTLDPVARGWLSLGSLAASTGQQGIGWNNGVVRWRESNIDHPAITILEDLQLPEIELLDYPRQVALLLPLSGRMGSIGEAIQNGFIGAYFATAAGLDDRQVVRVYDVNAEGGASAAYAAAVADGAEFVVGPLLKGNVVELANDILVPVPVLTLNYLPENTLAPPGLYQFALAPEDEAMSAAQRAIAEGHTRAVALVPNNDWGRRLFSSFATEFEGLGGTLLDYRSYTPGKQDFSAEIEDLMALSGSVRRYQRLRANIGGPLQFDPRRRQDVEFIFLGADASAGRLLKSQLKFHYSGDIPVFSTSSIYAQDGRSNSDLNGVMFTDTPWVIAPQGWIEALPDLYAEYWPEQKRQGRLHAMGYDAYNLVAALFAAQGRPMAELDGATGKLFLDQEGRVHRKLAWAQFQGGEPVAQPDLEQQDPGSAIPLLDAPIDDDEQPQPWFRDDQEL
jgi:outer membrane PBP1 activator LpoA protein